MTKRLIAFSMILALTGVVWYSGRSPHQEATAMNYNTLTPAEQRVILGEGTERAFSGEFNNHHEAGVYTCKQCDRPLFDSESKFDSRTGWPSFDAAITGAIREVRDGRRIEIECANCGGHIGHVFRGEQMTAKSTRHCANSISLNFVAESNEERAIFAGGCFWGVEHHLEQISGVMSVVSGYIGGKKENPNYKDVSYRNTGHVEAVEVTYDGSKVSYETIARMFFEIHDPTQVNRQGPDVGEQYRSAVFYLDDEQRETTEKLIGLLDANGLDVVTEVRPAGQFWVAENYHQNYYAKNGKKPYCHRWTKRF